MSKRQRYKEYHWNVDERIPQRTLYRKKKSALQGEAAGSAAHEFFQGQLLMTEAVNIISSGTNSSDSEDDDARHVMRPAETV